MRDSRRRRFGRQHSVRGGGGGGGAQRCSGEQCDSTFMENPSGSILLLCGGMRVGV